MTRWSHSPFGQLVVTLVLLTVLTAPIALEENIGQAEVGRLSPRLTSQNSFSSRQVSRLTSAQPIRLVGVVEPGRLLNIFLGVVLVVGLAVFNSFLFIALGVTGSLPQRFVRPNRNRATPQANLTSSDDIDGAMPPWVGRVFNALDQNPHNSS